jgi:hypothetical protein
MEDLADRTVRRFIYADEIAIREEAAVEAYASC